MYLYIYLYIHISYNCWFYLLLHGSRVLPPLWLMLFQPVIPGFGGGDPFHSLGPGHAPGIHQDSRFFCHDHHHVTIFIFIFDHHSDNDNDHNKHNHLHLNLHFHLHVHLLHHHHHHHHYHHHYHHHHHHHQQQPILFGPRAAKVQLTGRAWIQYPLGICIAVGCSLTMKNHYCEPQLNGLLISHFL